MGLKGYNQGRKMDKRLAKRHKRQIARAKERVKVSEPDVRTPEEIKAAREASRPTGGRGIDGTMRESTGGGRSNAPARTGSTTKTGE